jgi:uncharacterized protein YyaL (SSP411 family)
MKKILIIFLTTIYVFGFDWSGKVHWIQNFKTAQHIAKQKHKLIMIDLSLSDCPPCQYIAKILYNNSKIANYINQNFIPVFYLIDKQKVPFLVGQYFTGTVPTLMFITYDDKLYYKIIGAREPKVFMQILKTITKDYKQNKKVKKIFSEPKTVHF